MNKQMLCEAFCQELAFADVPAGLAVRTGFTLRDGDALGFYITRHPAEAGKYRVEDSGLVVPLLEACGVNLDSGTRAISFHRLLNEYGASYDAESMELHSEYVTEDELPSEAMRFIALLLRVQDLELLNVDAIANTFREDVSADINRFLSGVLTIQYRVAPHKMLSEFEADALLQQNGQAVALYFATTDERVNEAVILWMENEKLRTGLKVALMLEREKPPQINNRSLRRAMNRLDATTVYRGDEITSLIKIASLAGIAPTSISLN